MIITKNQLLKIIILSIIFIIFQKGISNASVHSTDPSGTTNSTVSITVTSTEPLENFDLSITSTDGLTYKSVSTSGIPNQSTGAVSYAGLTGITTLATYTFQTPSKPGRYKVSFSVNGAVNNSFVTVTEPETANTNDNTTTNEPTSNENTTTVTETVKSNNANLSNLGIRPNDFSGFKPLTTAYNVTVPNDVDEVTVYANLQDSKATLTGTGAKKLEVGKNTLNVVVTAEDGTKKTYTINVTREEVAQENTETEEEPAENEAENTSTDLINLEIKGYEIKPKFSPNIYEYTLEINENITNLEVITEGASRNVNIEVVGNTELKDGENTITILVHNEETNLNSTYQIIVNKTNIDLAAINATLNDGTKEANKNRYIIRGLLIFIAICIVIFIVARKKYKAQNEANAIYEYDEEDVERINNEKLDLDDEEEFFNRVNQKDTLQEEIIENYEEEPIKKIKEKEGLETLKTKRKGKHF